MNTLFSYPLLILALQQPCQQEGTLELEKQIIYKYEQKSMNSTTRITVGGQSFLAELADHPAAEAFRKQLPLTLTMKELNNNEKFARLPKKLPTDEVSPGTIQTGDLLLWGDDTIVLFYKTFSSPYSYTRVGRITNVSGLERAVGKGDVVVVFELP